MSKHGTTSEFPDWYIKFQAKVLQNLPRPPLLTEDVAAGWSANRAAMKAGFEDLFIPPPPEVVVANPAEPKQDPFAFWLAKMPGFYEKFLNVTFDPAEWNIPAASQGWLVYEPEGISTRDAVERILRPKAEEFAQYRLLVFQEISVENYVDTKANEVPKLVLVGANSEPDQKWRKNSNTLRASGKFFLNQRRYVILIGLVWYILKTPLDVQGWTLFPESRVSDTCVGYGDWNGVGVRLGQCGVGYDNPDSGGREETILSRIS